MAKYVFLAFTNPRTAAQEGEFNQWYEQDHVRDVLNVPGFISARRFRLAQTQFPLDDQAHTHRYLALYEIETDDAAATLQEVIARVGSPDMQYTDAFNMDTLQASLFEEIMPVLKAEDVQRPRRA